MVCQLASSLSFREKVEVFGRLCVRAVLLLVRKQKLGRETTAWDSFETIRDRFAEEIMGRKPAQQSPALPAEPAASAPVNLLDASKASMILMQNKRLEISANYLNVEAHGNKIFKLAEVTDAGCQFEHKPLFKDSEIVLVSPSEDMHKWKKTKKTAQVTISRSPIRACGRFPRQPPTPLSWPGLRLPCARPPWIRVMPTRA